jgi:cytochrome c peroxidase
MNYFLKLLSFYFLSGLALLCFNFSSSSQATGLSKTFDGLVSTLGSREAAIEQIKINEKSRKLECGTKFPAEIQQGITLCSQKKCLEDNDLRASIKQDAKDLQLACTGARINQVNAPLNVFLATLATLEAELAKRTAPPPRARGNDKFNPQLVYPGTVSDRNSAASPIALCRNNILGVVNRDNQSVSFFNPETNEKLTTLGTGFQEPSSLVFHPTCRFVYVVHRAGAVVVKISITENKEFKIIAKTETGSEPVGAALSPLGTLLFVTEWAQSRVLVIRTNTMKILRAFESVDNPYAVAVTNNGNNKERDEVVVVTQFYGAPVPGKETQDNGRVGRVFLYSLARLGEFNVIDLNPIRSGFTPSVERTEPHFTSPNQLYSLALHKNKAYVTSISASPESDPNPPAVEKGPKTFLNPIGGNVHPVIYVADLGTAKEDQSLVGSTNLGKLILNANLAEKANFLADTIHIADSTLESTNDSTVLYGVSRGGDILQRVEFQNSAEKKVEVGSAGVVQINLLAHGCRNPIGVAISQSASLNKAFVNCWNSRNVAVVDLATQKVSTTFESEKAPQSALEKEINKGARFFFTGTGRWAKQSVSSCASCHSEGLSDGITWSFPAGPRQSTSLDGSFTHLNQNTVTEGIKPQRQRILNWTAIFDEVHDFERNTRGVSGGFGAITQPKAGQNCKNAETEERKGIDFGNLAKPLKEVQDKQPTCPAEEPRDWDVIETWMKTIRPPRAFKVGKVGSKLVDRGKEVFIQHRCHLCHGGEGWTGSKRFWTPSESLNVNVLVKEEFIAPPAWPSTWNFNSKQIQPQPIIIDKTTGPLEQSIIGPEVVACTLRNVGTFGLPELNGFNLGGPTTDSLEKKFNGQRAQGRGGFNIPSLYGLALGAPYFHHGQAATLDEVLTDPKWKLHFTAGEDTNNPIKIQLSIDQQRADLLALKSFLLSIDAETSPMNIPPEFDGCPTQCQTAGCGLLAPGLQGENGKEFDDEKDIDPDV